MKQNIRQNDVFFCNCTSITNWHVITARYLSKRVVSLSHLIFSTGRGTVEAINVVITHSWRMGEQIELHKNSLTTVPVVPACLFKILTFVLKFLALGNLMCAQEPQWLRVAWWTRTFCIRSPTAHAQSVYNLRSGGCMLMQYWLLGVNVHVHHTKRSHRGSWAHVRLPRTEIFQTVSHKKYIAIPMMKGRDEKPAWHKGIWRYHGESVRGSLRWERFGSWHCTQ